MAKLKPYQRIGTPELGDGQRILTLKETHELMQKPHMKAAIEKINRIEGLPRAAEVFFHNEGKSPIIGQMNRLQQKAQKDKGIITL